jgi:hypothetical protein
MNPHGRPWGPEEARRAAVRRWADPAAREAQAQRMRAIRQTPTPTQAQRRGRKGGLRSGMTRRAQARQRAVTAALDLLKQRRHATIADVIAAVYRRAYRTGWFTAHARAKRRTA